MFGPRESTAVAIYVSGISTPKVHPNCGNKQGQSPRPKTHPGSGLSLPNPGSLPTRTRLKRNGDSPNDTGQEHKISLRIVGDPS